jgi:excisionase family DNA binding protein
MTAVKDGALVGIAGAKLLTVDDLCEYLVVSKDFIYDEVRHGRLRASRIARQLRFRQADVDAFVQANAVADQHFLRWDL